MKYKNVFFPNNKHVIYIVINKLTMARIRELDLCCLITYFLAHLSRRVFYYFDGSCHRCLKLSTTLAIHGCLWHFHWRLDIIMFVKVNEILKLVSSILSLRGRTWVRCPVLCHSSCQLKWFKCVSVESFLQDQEILHFVYKRIAVLVFNNIMLLSKNVSQTKHIKIY